MQLVTASTKTLARDSVRIYLHTDINIYIYIHTQTAHTCSTGWSKRIESSMWASVGGGSTDAAAAIAGRGSGGVYIQPLRWRKKGGGVGPPTTLVQEGRDEDSESVALSAPPDSPGLAC